MKDKDDARKDSLNGDENCPSEAGAGRDRLIPRERERDGAGSGCEESLLKHLRVRYDPAALKLLQKLRSKAAKQKQSDHLEIVEMTDAHETPQTSELRARSMEPLERILTEEAEQAYTHLQKEDSPARQKELISTIRRLGAVTADLREKPHRG